MHSVLWADEQQRATNRTLRFEGEGAAEYGGERPAPASEG